jgi:LAO/AO transport system kinase
LNLRELCWSYSNNTMLLPVKPNSLATVDLEQFAQRVRTGERRALAKALSLLESTRPEDASIQHRLLSLLYRHSGNAWRIGITGPPGAGKSTFIEAFGSAIVSRGRRVAVLSIDPAGAYSGGSILGDKLRMTTLATSPNAFIRPSSNRGSSTALSVRIRECIVACEAAGYDTVIVETVGSGQSDTAIADVTDMVILATLPNAGDEVQGIKRGVIELADLVVVTKADIDPAATQRATSQLRSALMLIAPRHPDWHTAVLAVSSISGEGIEHVWSMCEQYFSPQRMPTLEQQRRHQRSLWFERSLLEQLYATTVASASAPTRLEELRNAVERGEVPPPLAAAMLLTHSTSSAV